MGDHTPHPNPLLFPVRAGGTLEGTPSAEGAPLGGGASGAVPSSAFLPAPVTVVAVVEDTCVVRDGPTGARHVELHGLSTREAVFETLTAVYMGVLRQVTSVRGDVRYEIGCGVIVNFD